MFSFKSLSMLIIFSLVLGISSNAVAGNDTNKALNEFTLSKPSISEYVAVTTNEVFLNEIDSLYNVKVFDANSAIGNFRSFRRRLKSLDHNSLKRDDTRSPANPKSQLSSSINLANAYIFSDQLEYTVNTPVEKVHLILKTNHMVIQFSPQLNKQSISNILNHNNWKMISKFPEKNIAIVEGDFLGQPAFESIFDDKYKGDPGRELQFVYDTYASYLNDIAAHLQKQPDIVFAAPDFQFSEKDHVDLSKNQSLALAAEKNTPMVDSWWKDDLIARSHLNVGAPFDFIIDDDTLDNHSTLTFKTPRITGDIKEKSDLTDNGRSRYVFQENLDNERKACLDCEN